MNIVSPNDSNFNRSNKQKEIDTLNSDETNTANLDDEIEQAEPETALNKQKYPSLGHSGLNTTNNTSGIGSIASPNSACDATSNNSIYNTYASNNTHGSIPVTPSTPPSNYEHNSSHCESVTSSSASSSSKININAPIFNMTPAKSNQQQNMDLMNKLNFKNTQSGQSLTKDMSSDNLSSQGGNISPRSNQSTESSNNEHNQYKNNYLPNLNNYLSLPIGLGSNSGNGLQLEYDPFNDYMGMDKQMALQMASNPGMFDAVMNQKKGDSQQMQQQQFLAQAIAAAAAAAVANSNNNGSDNQSQSKSNQHQQRSLIENIEQLNSKFMTQKHQHSSQMDQNNNNIMNKNVNFNSLLAAAAAVANNTNNNNLNSSTNNASLNDSISNYSSPSPNYKRQSAGAFMNPNMLFSTPIPNSTSPTSSNNNTVNNNMSSTNANNNNNNRLNSTPNMGFNNNIINEQNRYFSRSTATGSGANQAGHSSPDKMNSMSASNSSFNLSGSNNLDLACGNNANTSAYDDDDVFTNTSLNMNQSNNGTNNGNANNGSNSNNNNNNINPLLLANAGNLDPYMYQLYRNLIASNLNSSNLNDLLLNNTSNLSNLSLNSATDMLNTNNSNNFLNLTGSSNSTFNQLKGMNSFNQTNNSNISNNSGNLSNGSSNPLNLSQAQLAAAAAAAVLKQRQQNSMINNNGNAGNRQPNNMMGNQGNNLSGSNSNMNNNNSNNMASFLNSSNSLQQQQQQNYMNMNGDQNSNKRRINSIATAYNLGSSSNGNNSLLQISNNSSMFPSTSTHNVGPNASHLLQNSSLASSARLNTSTSTNATASVLGNNSSLSHALNSLQHQSSSQMLQNQANFNNLNSSPTPSSNHNLLSALSLSSSSGVSLTNALLSNGKPLRSERLPSQVVDEIIKQAKIRRRQGGKKEVCVFCRNNGEKEQIYTSHTLKDAQNSVACPILRLYQCPICHASGDQAHTIKYCPYAEKDSACIKLFKENGRMSAAAALLMNTFPGGNTPPGSPPGTPSPSQSHQLSFINQSISPNMSSSNNAFAQALNNLSNYKTNFNLANANMGSKSGDLSLNLNKSYGGASSSASSNNPASNNNNNGNNTQAY